MKTRKFIAMCHWQHGQAGLAIVFYAVQGQGPKMRGRPQKNDQKQNQNQPPKITPQAAQQMLQAIQNKENETQDKVKKEKAKLLESLKNEKNW